jgi:hypothetical protein
MTHFLCTWTRQTPPNSAHGLGRQFGRVLALSSGVRRSGFSLSPDFRHTVVLFASIDVRSCIKNAHTADIAGSLPLTQLEH